MPQSRDNGSGICQLVVKLFLEIMVENKASLIKSIIAKTIKANLLIITLAALLFTFSGCSEKPAIGDESYNASVSLISYELIDGEFDGVIYREITDLSKLVARSDIPLLIAFYQQMNDINISVIPLLEEIAVLYDDRIHIVWVDVDREIDLAEQFSVRQTPQFTVVDQAVIKRSLIGISDQGRQELIELITQYVE